MYDKVCQKRSEVLNNPPPSRAKVKKIRKSKQLVIEAKLLMTWVSTHRISENNSRFLCFAFGINRTPCLFGLQTSERDWALHVWNYCVGMLPTDLHGTLLTGPHLCTKLERNRFSRSRDLERPFHVSTCSSTPTDMFGKKKKNIKILKNMYDGWEEITLRRRFSSTLWEIWHDKKQTPVVIWLRKVSAA